MSPRDDEGRPDDVESSDVGAAAVKWAAVVIIVLSVLYFLAQYVIPLLSA